MRINTLSLLLLLVGVCNFTMYGQCPSSDPGYIILDFENDGNGNPLQAGQIIDDQTYAAYGIMLYSLTSAGLPASAANPLVIFDSANPTGGDCDLGTPGFNCPSNTTDTTDDCAGAYPGQSLETAAGGGQNNCVAENNILIIEENFTDTNNDGLDDDPDDLGGGGIIRMVFSNPYNLQNIHFVDDASGEIHVTFSDNTMQTVTFAVGLDNDVYTVVFNLLDVVQVDIDLVGSGGFASIELCDLVTGSISNQLYYDVNGNNTYQNGIDVGIPNVDVKLFDINGLVATTTTNAQGQYIFNDLIAGDYTVMVDSNDADYPTSSNPVYDYDGIVTPNTADVTLGAGENNEDLDFGYRGTGIISDLLFIDQNNNNTFDSGIDLPIPNVNVEITYCNGYTQTVTTDNNGQYIFSDLSACNYTIKIITTDVDFPTGITPSVDYDGIGTAHSAMFDLADGQQTDLVDFGYKGLGSISNQLYYNVNGINTYQNGIDIGIANVDVKLIYSNGYVATTTTNAQGQYIFNNLAAGDYTVMVDSNDADYPTSSNPIYDYDGIVTPNTADVALGASENNVDLDFGYQGSGSISDQLFIDQNNNNTYDSGVDMVIPNVDVEITYCNGYKKTVTSDSNGEYIFNNLPACNYTIEVVTTDLDFPVGISPSVDYDGIGTAHTAMFDLADGQQTDLVDFGYKGLGSISNQLYYDVNSNNTYQDGIDVGIANVDVKLIYSNGYIATTTTNAQGQYIFNDLTAGDYTVMVDTNDADYPTSSNPTYDYDGIVTPNTADVTLGANENNVDLDFGYRGTGSISDQLFIDINDNNSFDSGVDIVIPNVDVEITYCNGYIQTVTTDNDGQYIFNNLPGCNYTIEVVTTDVDFPAGIIPSVDYDGVATAHTAMFNLAAGQNTNLVDFGYKGTGSISDQLFIDVNNNDTYDIGVDLPIPNVDIKITYCNGFSQTVTSDNDGQYSFNNLPACNYTIEVVTTDVDFPAGITPSIDYDGIGTAHTAMFDLAAGQSTDLVDFGYKGLGSISNQLYYDINSNNTYQDGIDVGITNLNVKLIYSNGYVATTTTNALGQYIFNDLPAGSYTVMVDDNDVDFPGSSAPVYDYDGTSTANSSQYSLGAGEDNVAQDFGYRGIGSISNQLFIDMNNNNIYDSGMDMPIPNVDVEITYCNGYTKTVTSNSNGEYIFNNLPACNYTIEVVTTDLDFPAGIIPSVDYDGIGTAHTAMFDLADGQNTNLVDFGYKGTGSISDQLFIDVNNNNTFDSGVDLPIPNVDIEITYCNGYSQTVTTNNDGQYIFDNLLACNYTIEVVTTDVDFPAGITPSVDYDGIATAHTAMFDLATGQNTDLVDFGYKGLGSISNQLYYDVNSNNTYQDGIDVGIANVDVKLVYSNGYIVTTTTNTFGQYIFNELPADDYTVIVDINDVDFPSSSAPVYDYDGTATPNTSQYSLSGGENNVDQDFGYRGSGSIANQLFIDVNNNNTYETGIDLPIPNVDVEITYCNGYKRKVTSNSNGQYIFNNLPECNYTIEVLTTDVDFPAGISPSVDYDGIGTAHTAMFDLADGQNTNLVDFGYKGLGSISNQLYFDINGNNTYQDGIDPGLINVDVKLTYSNGYVETTTTDNLGQYIFNDLPAGDYTVAVNSNDSDYPSFSTPVYDYDGTASVNTSEVTLGASEHNVEQDFGYRGTGSISNQLYIDINNNNIYDLNKDLIIINVDVELTYCNGAKVTVTSDSNGEYIFNNLPPCNNYIVTVISSDPDFPAGIIPSYDKDGISTAHTTTVNLADSEDKIDVDFGYQGSGSISNLLYVDMNYNSTYEAVEDEEIAFVDVELIDQYGTSIYTTTDVNGEYMFDYLPPGTYTVTVMIGDPDFPNDVVPKEDYDGVNTEHTSTITLGMSEDNDAVDFVYQEVVLPVAWDQFSGKKEKEDVELYWSTWSESNASHYEVERSKDGYDFETIGRVYAVGSTTAYSEYRFKDYKLNNGIYYYRLKQVDFDGRYDFSKIITIQMDPEQNIRIFPNPVQNRLYVDRDNEEIYHVDIIEAATGRLIKSSGLIKDYVEVQDLETGVYLIRISNSNTIKTLPFIKL